ncbi:MAG: relaxase MobL [Eubacterium sp.]|jgi:hypothetical protein|nr:relaxase MobL [Eubacterium sp.]
MALLIYKQWHRQPNKKDTPASNAAHVKYIGERVHVMKADGCDNGLFGKFSGQNYSYKIDMDQAMKFVNRISRNGHTVFRSTVSFTTPIAKTLNLEDKISFEKYIKYHVNSIAKHNGIKISNFEYLAAVHDKEVQPHFHVIFWDKAQEVGKNFVNPLVGDEIRNDLEESAVNEMLSEIELPEGFSQDWKTNDSIRRDFIKRSFKSAFDDEYSNQKISAENIAGLLKNEMAGDIGDNSELARQFRKLYAGRPRTGRNYYSFMPGEYKRELDKFTDMLIGNNPLLEAEYDKMMTSHEAIAFALNSSKTNYGKFNITSYLGKMKDKLYAKVGNHVLRELKNEALKLKLSGNDHQPKFQPLNFTKYILKAIKAFAPGDNCELPGNSPQLYGDLSKAALKDLQYKKQDKGRENV